MPNKVEKLIILFTALACLIIPVFDFLGLLDNVPWLAQRIPIMILLALGVIASYLLVSFQKLDEKSKIYKDELLKEINSDEIDKKIIRQVNEIWDSREAIIQDFFDHVKIYSLSKDRQPLFDCLDQVFLDFSSGNFFGIKMKRPWDFTIGALDFRGIFLYHPSHAMVSTVSNSDRTKEILRIRNGSFVWINKGMSEQVGLITDQLLKFRFPRFTKVYFKEFVSLNAIIIFESHINLLHELQPLDMKNLYHEKEK